MVQPLSASFSWFFRAGLLVLLIFFGVQKSQATHIVGAELYYRCLNPSTHSYEVTLVMYRDCKTGEAPFDDPITLFIFRATNPALYSTVDIPKPANTPEVIPEDWAPCVGRSYDLCIERAIYKTIITLQPVTGGYNLGWARCCRNASITNLFNPLSQGVTFLSHVPGPEHAVCNSSPVFNNELPIFICAGKTFTFDHSALDSDGDSLAYSMSNPFGGLNTQGIGVGDCDVVMLPPVVGNTGNCAGSQMIFNPLGPPPYQTVNYASGQFNSQNPFGPGTASIDPGNGMLTFNPPSIGIFVVAISVKEYRNGILLSENKRDIQIHVIACNISGSPPRADHDLSVIDSLNPGLSVTYGSGDTIYAVAGTPFCYEATVWDTVLSDQLVSFPVSDIFGGGSGFFPPAATMVQTNSGSNPIDLKICWSPACEYIGDTLPMLIGGRDAGGCERYNFAYDTVLIVIVPPPVVGPKVEYSIATVPSVADTVVLRVDSLGCFNWWVTDTLHTGHLNYSILIEDLAGNSALSPSTNFSKFQDSIALNSCIRPDCDMMGGLFRIILEANDNSFCPPDAKDRDTLYLRVPQEPNPPPVIFHDLSGNLFVQDTIVVDVHDQLCYDVVVKDTFPASAMTWGVSIEGVNYSGPSPALSVITQLDSTVLRICWTPNCEAVGRNFLLRTFATQENACDQFQTVYDSVFVKVNDVINPSPVLSHNFLPGFQVNGDSLYVAADSAICFGFEISDSGAHTFLEIDFEILFAETGAPSGHSPNLSLTAESDSLISGTLCFQPGCDFRGALLKVAIWGRDTFDCVSSNHVFDSVFIRITDPFNQPSTITHDISMLPGTMNVVEVHPEGKPFCYTVRLDDPDGNLAKLVADGNSDVFMQQFGHGNPATVTFSGTNPLDMNVCWNPSCYEKNQQWSLVICGKDSSRCDLSETVCDTVFFKVLDCKVFFQNIFSPNGDGLNDMFLPFDIYGVRYFDMKILDRWGVPVFEQRDTGWNGILPNGRVAQEGVYFWIVEYEYWSAEGKPLRKREVGNVTLLR